MLTLLIALSIASPLELATQTGPEDAVWSVQTHAFAGGDRHRATATWKGLDVVGADVIVVGDTLRSSNPWDRPTGRLAVPQKVAQDVAQRLLGGAALAWAPRVEPVIVAFDGARYAWQVDVASANPFAAWRVWVDGETGRALAALPTSFSADGSVYSGDPLSSQVQTVTLEGLSGDDALSGEFADVFSCDDAEIGESLFDSSVCNGLSRHAVPDSSGNFLFEPEPESYDDPFAEVHLYHHLDIVSRWAQDTYGFSRASPTTAFTNFEMANAFYGDFDGDGVADIAMGQFEGIDLTYDPDVIYHEFGHGIVGGVAALGFLDADETGLRWDGGALNEGTADVIALLLTQDPAIGAYAGTAFDRTAIRDLVQPRSCPEDLVGEVHADGLLWGHLFYRLTLDERLELADVEALLWGALSTWGPTTDWTEAGESLLDAAEDLRSADALSDDGVTAVEEAVSAANLIDCERVIDLVNDEEHDALLLFTGIPGALEVLPAEVQYRITMPADGSDVDLCFTEWSDRTDNIGYRIHVRRGQPVGHEIVDLSLFGLRTAVPTDFDADFDGEGTGLALTLGPEGDMVTTAGEVLYVSLASRPIDEPESLEFTFARVTLQINGEVIEPATRGGCSCSQSGTPVFLWPLMGLLPMFWRRRPKTPTGN